MNTVGEGERQVTEFVIGKNYFPYFLSKENLTLTSATIYLKPKEDEAINTNNLTLLKINNTQVGSWTINAEIEHFKETSVTLSGQPDKTWTIDAGIDGFNKEDLDDIIILINYKIQ